LRKQISFVLPHEMRTPLNGIISNAELLATNEEFPLPASEISVMGREISQSGQRLERLIENFLAYAQIELLAADPQGVNALCEARIAQPREIVRQTAVSLADRASRNNDLTVEADDGTLAIAEDYFKKIVTELVQNALKFSEAGTPVRVQLVTSGNEMEFSVRDAGRGFSPEQIQRIGAYVQFERKMQDVEGLGLGLAIARKLTELHRGTFSIESQPGQGSKVSFRLPLAK
jgi:two-component system, sensor histidine kinase and response regulator